MNKRHLLFSALAVAWSVQAATPNAVLDPTAGAKAAAAEAATAAAGVSAGPADVDAQPRKAGIESPDYKWNDQKGEELLALKATGDAKRGQEAFEICAGCHGTDALGQEDGTYPRMAGQHASVLIKQMTDIRSGIRDEPQGYPFQNQHVLDVQGIADIAAYLQQLPVPPGHGQGPGGDLSEGERIYKDACQDCHGPAGEGKGKKFYPKISDQHYAYMLRQTFDIRDGQRRNANPDMVDSVARLSDSEIVAVTDYVSRFGLNGAGAGAAKSK